MYKNKVLTGILNSYFLRKSRLKGNGNSEGFSLIELLVVVLIIGVFSAIAVPSWDAFVSRQRTRVVNDQVYQILRTTQAEAKRHKSNYVIEFNEDADPPEYSIYLAGTNDDNKIWQSLDGNSQIQANQIGLEVVDQGSDPPNSITFDYTGSPNTSNFRVVTSLPDGGMKRCVIIETLLGNMKIAQDADCES